MWMVVYVAQSLETAEKIKELILAHGLLVKVRAINTNADEKYGCYEILVPESELNEAHECIINESL
ncbi:MAG: hypothetical protein J6L59_02750 [Clostridia bacterium]|nr:hypothetical protein [Clostridia bacterium]